MWAQLIKARAKPGREDEISQIQKEFESDQNARNAGWVRSISLQNQDDPLEFYSLVFFETEEKARANEQAPEQQAIVKRLMDCFDGPPSFVNLNPIYEGSR